MIQEFERITDSNRPPASASASTRRMNTSGWNIGVRCYERWKQQPGLLAQCAQTLTVEPLNEILNDTQPTLTLARVTATATPTACKSEGTEAAL